MNVARKLKIIAMAKRLAALAEIAEKELIAHRAAGNDIPGWMVAVRRSPKREWINEDHAKKVLIERGVPETFLTVTSMPTFAQLEKRLPRELLEGLFHQPQRGVALVPATSNEEEAEF